MIQVTSVSSKRIFNRVKAVSRDRYGLAPPRLERFVMGAANCKKLTEAYPGFRGYPVVRKRAGVSVSDDDSEPEPEVVAAEAVDGIDYL